jgi:hypothetical protein
VRRKVFRRRIRYGIVYLRSGDLCVARVSETESLVWSINVSTRRRARVSRLATSRLAVFFGKIKRASALHAGAGAGASSSTGDPVGAMSSSSSSST